ncbi:GSCOCG00000602001-RA-CDS [Cotesia congregata]|nr:GSCOCG00000602001-RA-CDS [Cotesia congregata]
MIGRVTRIIGRFKDQLIKTQSNKLQKYYLEGPWKSRRNNLRCNSSPDLPRMSLYSSNPLIGLQVKLQMPRNRRRHRSRTHSRSRSQSAGSQQYEHKRRRIDYESPQSKGTYRNSKILNDENFLILRSGERVLRSRQHERGTSQERRYKRSHRRSPSSGRHHLEYDNVKEERVHTTRPSSREARRIRWARRRRAPSSESQESSRHRHKSPSRSQVSIQFFFYIHY